MPHLTNFHSVLCFFLLMTFSQFLQHTAIAFEGGNQEKAFRPGEIWRDDQGVAINAHGGGILLYEGVYYWFGEHKIAGPRGNSAQIGVHVYSSRNLYDWKDEGIALKVSDDPKSDIVQGCILERPKVIYNPATKKFVMWFHLELRGKGYSAARAGVAMADTPTGPYEYKESFRLNAGQWPKNVLDTDKVPGKDNFLERDFRGGQMSRDMTLYVDDDGKAYQITASEENQTLHISLLTDDFLNTTGEYVRILPGKANEAPALFKYNKKYYLITSGCTGWKPNAARLAEADSIWGPWRGLGDPCVGPAEQTQTTFQSQSTFILPAPGKPDSFIFMADRWNPRNPIDGRYVWLPIQFKDDKPFLEWKDNWRLDFFTSGASR